MVMEFGYGEEDRERYENEMLRKSKVMKGRRNNLKDFKKNEKVYKGSLFKASFEFHDDFEGEDIEENYILGNGRYKRYYNSDLRTHLKRRSNKLLRRNVPDLPVKGNDYRRYLDIMWILY